MCIYHLGQYQAAADNDHLCNLKIKERMQSVTLKKLIDKSVLKQSRAACKGTFYLSQSARYFFLHVLN